MLIKKINTKLKLTKKDVRNLMMAYLGCALLTIQAIWSYTNGGVR